MSFEDIALWTEKVPTFEENEIKDQVLRGLYSIGYEKPSEIQQLAIKPMLLGRDIIAQAQAGSGKTGAFAVGILNKINPDLKAIQGLVIVPTRELAQQTLTVLEGMGSHMNIRVHAFYGGTNVAEDFKAMRAGIHVAVGTPGRLLHLLETRNGISLRRCSIVVLDEADVMLSRGFFDSISQIFRYIPPEAQVGLFSATMPADVLQISTKFMRNPVRILIRKETEKLGNVRQYFVPTPDIDTKIDVLIDLYSQLQVPQVIVFCETCDVVNRLSQHMLDNDFTVSAIHGEMSQEARDEVMQSFRNGETRVLIATDLLARGIDVIHVKLVINFDLPSDRENYLHRVGRAGRFARQGAAINFIMERDVRYIHDLEQYHNTNISHLPENLEEIFA